jgi:hypothetical protein
MVVGGSFRSRTVETFRFRYRNVQVPMMWRVHSVLKFAAYAYHAPVEKSISYATQHLLGCVVEVVSGDDDDPPSHPVESLATLQLMQPLLTVLGMLPTVVLDDQFERGIAHVEAHPPRTVRKAKDEIDLRYRETGQYEQHANRVSIAESTPSRT